MEQTRRRILQAALELFSKNGFAGTTTREIAQKAEITEVTLFRHFNSKETIFEETILNFLPSPDFKILISKANEMNYKKALRLIAHSFFEGLEAHKDLINIMYMESQRHFELMERIYTVLVKNLVILLTEYFVELQSKNLLRNFDPEVMATTFLGMFYFLYEHASISFYSHQEIGSAHDKINDMVDIFAFGTDKPAE